MELAIEELQRRLASSVTMQVLDERLGKELVKLARTGGRDLQGLPKLTTHMVARTVTGYLGAGVYKAMVRQLKVEEPGMISKNGGWTRKIVRDPAAAAASVVSTPDLIFWWFVRVQKKLKK